MHTHTPTPRLRTVISLVCIAGLTTSCGRDPVSVQRSDGHGGEGRSRSPDLSLIVSNTTTGGAFDLDGFTVLINGVLVDSFEVNDQLRVYDLFEGRHVIRLDGVAANCSTGPDSTRTVDVTRGATARVNLEVVCTPPPELASTRIVFARARGSGSTLVAMNSDGSDRTQLFGGKHVFGPDVSPDRSRILFTMGSTENYRDTLSVYAMNTDGSDVTKLVEGPASDARWSPDGEEIAYVAGLGYYGGALHVMAASGSESTQLAGPDNIRFPNWSPDGQRIAFAEFDLFYWDWADSYYTVWVTDRLGSRTRLWGQATYTAWSPIDDLIVLGSAGIRVVSPSGSYTKEPLLDRIGAVPHDWSADGALLLFTEGGRSWSRRREGTGVAPGLPDRTDVYLLVMDTGEVVRLTADGAHNITPTFW